MSPAVEQSATDTGEEPDPFPEEGDVYVWAAEDGFRCGNAEDYEDELPDDIDLEPVPARGRDEMRAPAIVFDPGDELPPSLARDIWASFSDRIAVFDENGDRVTPPGQRETDAAIERWRMYRNHSPPESDHSPPEGDHSPPDGSDGDE